MSPDLFGKLTPYQTSIWMDGKIERLNEENKQSTFDYVWLAYFTANWTRAKSMPNWDRLLSKLGLKEKKKQNVEDMIKMAEMWTIAMGGKDLRKKDKD